VVGFGTVTEVTAAVFTDLFVPPTVTAPPVGGGVPWFTVIGLVTGALDPPALDAVNVTV
jgi:hypothetical protein